MEAQNTIDRPLRGKCINRKWANIITDAYLEIGNLSQAKNYLYRDVSFEVAENYYLLFAEEVSRLKLCMLEQKYADAK
jgi:hypothetical protein